MRPRIFEPFFRVPSTGPREGQASTGLGLALTRKLVAAHGGHMGYDSALAEGTTFGFTLPPADTPAFDEPSWHARRARSFRPDVAMCHLGAMRST